MHSIYIYVCIFRELNLKELYLIVVDVVYDGSTTIEGWWSSAG